MADQSEGVTYEYHYVEVDKSSGREEAKMEEDVAMRKARRRFAANAERAMSLKLKLRHARVASAI